MGWLYPWEVEGKEAGFEGWDADDLLVLAKMWQVSCYFPNFSHLIEKGAVLFKVAIVYSLDLLIPLSMVT